MAIVFKLAENLVKKLQTSALDTEQVWVQYICQTGPDGEHDPDAPPDDRVRPSHAAFHGKVFRIDEAPIPPLDYGCRCAIRYVAKPGSDADDVLETTSPTDATVTAIEATEGWLKDNLANLDKYIAIAKAVRTAEAIGKVQEALRADKVADSRNIAEMVVDLAKTKPKAGAA
jgi:uncharacterized protein with gpF-like domain